MRERLVIGNWKLNGSTESNCLLIESIKKGLEQQPASAKVVVCPPLVYIAPMVEMLHDTNIQLGAQNICEHEKGAFTGEVSASMLTDFGVNYVLVGHSERRSLFGDTNERVAAKFQAVLKQGMIPVLCVGETLEQRERNQMLEVIDEQLRAILKTNTVQQMVSAVIAYEPVWAIGTGLTASPEQAQEIHQFIRNWLKKEAGDVANKTPLLYGGSVNAENAQMLFSQVDIDGGLIGGASLQADSFLAICRS